MTPIGFTSRVSSVFDAAYEDLPKDEHRWMNGLSAEEAKALRKQYQERYDR